MLVVIDKKTSVPVYRQIEIAIKKKILNNELPFGAKLPAERKLAETLGVHRNTVVKAYKLLVDQELISCTVAHRKGYFVLCGKEENRREIEKKNRAVFQYSYHADSMERLFDDIYAASGQERYLSFAGHLIPKRLIPVKQLKEIMNCTVDDYGADAFSYCSAKGNPVLRRELSKQLEKDGIRAREAEIVIVNETTQGLEYVTECITASGDYIVSEYPIMPDAYHIFKRNGLKIIFVDMEKDGANLVQLETVFKQYRPKFFYTMPDYHSVTGIRMSLEKRVSLIELAYHYNVPIVEECWYTGLDYEDQGLPKLFPLDKYKNVITIDNAFTSFYTGAKIAYLLAPEGIIEKVSRHVSSSQTHLQNLEQLMFAEYMRHGHSEKQRRTMLDYFGKKRDTMRREIQCLWQTGTRWWELYGGLGYWCKLPDGVHDMRLYETLRKQGVLIFPGKLFFPEGSEAAGFMRLSFSNVSDENMRKGMKIIEREITNQK